MNDREGFNQHEYFIKIQEHGIQFYCPIDDSDITSVHIYFTFFFFFFCEQRYGEQRTILRSQIDNLTPPEPANPGKTMKELESDQSRFKLIRNQSTTLYQ